MREAETERMICQQARYLGITAIKLAGPGDKGKSDRLFLRHGKAAFMEIKALHGKPTALQLRFLAERRADGFQAEWFNEVGPAVKWLKEVFANAT